MAKRKQKKPMKKGAKIALKILICVGVVVLLFFCLLPVINSAVTNGHLKKLEKVEAITRNETDAEPVVVPTLEDGIYTFTTDRDLKILQLTDIHISGGLFAKGLDSKAISAVETMIRGTDPDLVMVTGDLSYATPLSLTLDNERAFLIFGKLMEKLGVYWTITYGNHDSEFYNMLSKKNLTEMLMGEEYPHCIVTDNYPDIQGVSNQFINVKNSKNIITQSIAIFDSNTYKGGKYDIIYDNQIEWYANGINSFSQHNKSVLATLEDSDLSAPKSTYETVKSIAFFHIPFEEFEHARDARINANNQDTDESKLIYGVMDEKVCRGYADNNLFEKMLELGSTKGVFVGHDHVNNACFDYKGIKLAYSYSIDYLAYGRLKKTDDYRGGTVIMVKPDASFTNELVSYKSLK